MIKISLRRQSIGHLFDSSIVNILKFGIETSHILNTCYASANQSQTQSKIFIPNRIHLTSGVTSISDQLSRLLTLSDESISDVQMDYIRHQIQGHPPRHHPPTEMKILPLVQWGNHPTPDDFWNVKQKGSVKYVAQSSLASRHLLCCEYITVIHL